MVSPQIKFSALLCSLLPVNIHGFCRTAGLPRRASQGKHKPGRLKKKGGTDNRSQGKAVCAQVWKLSTCFFGSIDAICLMSRKGSCCKAGMSSGNAGQSLSPSQAALSAVALVLTYVRFGSMPIQPACFFLTMKNVCCLQSNTQL